MLPTTLGFASLVVAVVSAGLWFRAIRRVDIPEDRTPFIAAWGLAAVLGAAALLGSPNRLGRIPAIFGLGTAGVFSFTVAISRQRLGEDAIRVGDKIPAFSAIDEFGQGFDSGSLSGHLVLIKFFRAHW